MGAGGSVPESREEESWIVLQRQDATTTNALIQRFGSENEDFKRLATFEGEAIAARDEEDATKLQAGITISIDRGVLKKLDPAPEYTTIDVLGKTPDQVCDIILEHMGEDAKTGGVLILCGLSGTGKGTTVARLQERLPNTTAWSNGNVFRSLTLLASTWCESQGLEEFDAEKALTPENVATFMNMLKFDKFDNAWDIQICGLGIDARVSNIKNTLLKSPKVSKNIPTVAEQTQGEVVIFASDATKKMAQDGFTVLLEGREATVNYIDSPFRYTLTMSDLTVLGQRRAAQRIAAAVLDHFLTLKSSSSPAEEFTPPTDQQVVSVVLNTTASMVAELPPAPSA